MSGIRIGDGPVVPAMLDVWDEVIIARVVTCDPGAVLMASAREGAKAWLRDGTPEGREAVIVKVDQDNWELTCALADGHCPWCGCMLNEAGQHVNAVMGAACERVHPRPAQDGEDG